MKNHSLRMGLVGVLAVLVAVGMPQIAWGQSSFQRTTRLNEPEQRDGMSVWSEMYPGVPVAGMHDPAADLPDRRGEEYMHFACHVRARADNAYGLHVGEWMPNLRVRFTLTNRQSGKTVEGDLFSLLDRGGPHYGINLRMIGEGEYTLVFFVKPPSAKQLARVTGEYAGVPDWFEPFSMTVQFTYDPTEMFGDE